MAGFLYFAAGIVNPVTDQTVTQLELRYAFERRPMFGRLEGRTPADGAAGTLLADESRRAELAYRPDEQVWRKRPGDDCVWIGYWKHSPPTPDDLRRATALAGEAIELGDGGVWTVPRLLWHAAESGFQLALPTYFDLDDEGKWMCGAVVEPYAALEAVADRLHAGVYRSEMPDGQRLAIDEMLSIAAQLLGVNYAISAVECAMLRLFNGGDQLRRIAEAAVDHGQAMEWLEKKSAAGDQPDAAG